MLHQVRDNLWRCVNSCRIKMYAKLFVNGNFWPTSVGRTGTAAERAEKAGGAEEANGMPECLVRLNQTTINPTGVCLVTSDNRPFLPSQAS